MKFLQEKKPDLSSHDPRHFNPLLGSAFRNQKSSAKQNGPQLRTSVLRCGWFDREVYQRVRKRASFGRQEPESVARSDASPHQGLVQRRV